MTTPSASVIARTACAICPLLLTPHTVFSESQSAEVVDEIVVTGERLEAGYLEKQAEIGFGFPADITRMPQSIQVVTGRLIEDLKPSTLSDIVAATGGISSPRNSVEPFSSFKMRGFTVSQTVVDGIRNTNSLNIQTEGLANFDQVEVLRGPGGAVYWLSSSDGVVNIVTKKPLSMRRLEASIGLGNFDRREGMIDLTGPLTADGSLRARLVAAYENRDSFVTSIRAGRFWAELVSTICKLPRMFDSAQRPRLCEPTQRVRPGQKRTPSSSLKSASWVQTMP